MRLHLKTLVIVASTMVVVSFSLWVVTQIVLMSGFSKVEKDDSIRNVERVRDAINGMIENISIKTADWAKWDDTYKFVIDHNKEYIASNLNEESMSDLQLNLMALIDTNHNFVFSMQYDSDLHSAMPLQPELKRSIFSDNNLISHLSPESILSGVFLVDKRPILVVSRPILNSQGKGPIHGTIIFGKFLSINEIERLQQLTHLSIQCNSFDSTYWSGLMKSHSGISSDSQIIIQPLNEKRIAGYIAINDIHAKPLLMLRIDLPRDIYLQGKKTNLYLIISMVIAGLILSSVILFLLETTVIRRIAKLNNDVEVIKTTSDNSARVSINGNDEITNFASSVNKMLAALESKEMLILHRNSEMRLLMNSIPVGLLSINENFEVNPEYSSSVEEILEQSKIAGKKFLNVLGFDNSDDTKQGMTDFLEIMQQNIIPENEITALNPCEEFNYKRGSISKWLQLRYFLIDRGEGIQKHILVAIENISDKKELSERVAISEKENLQLKIIAEDPDMFRELISEIQQILHVSLERIQNLNTPFSQALIQELFRNVHTIKGSAGAFGLIVIVDIAGVLEERLSQLRNSSEVDFTTINYIKDTLSQLQKITQETISNVTTLFGDEFTDNPDIHLRIPLDKINSGFMYFDTFLQSEQLDQDLYLRIRNIVKVQFATLRQVTAKRGLAKALKTAPGVIRRLKKNAIFTIKGSDVLIDCEIAKNLNTPLIHLIRNCLDHGIETTEDQRISAGKTAQGNVCLSIENTINEVIVEVTDDGRGLDTEYIKKSAVKKGFITEEDANTLTLDEAVALILLPGFSTKETVSEISGRGVGMDAVNTAVKDLLHGTLSITTKKGLGTTFKIVVPCSEITLL